MPTNMQTDTQQDAEVENRHAKRMRTLDGAVVAMQGFSARRFDGEATASAAQMRTDTPGMRVSVNKDDITRGMETRPSPGGPLTAHTPAIPENSRESSRKRPRSPGQSGSEDDTPQTFVDMPNVSGRGKLSSLDHTPKVTPTINSSSNSSNNSSSSKSNTESPQEGSDPPSDMQTFSSSSSREAESSGSAASLGKRRTVNHKRRLFDAKVTKFLRSWIDAHKADPYPSSAELDEMSESTGLSVAQLRQWFANARRRTLKPSRNSGKMRYRSLSTESSSSSSLLGMTSGMPGQNYSVMMPGAQFGHYPQMMYTSSQLHAAAMQAQAQARAAQMHANQWAQRMAMYNAMAGPQSHMPPSMPPSMPSSMPPSMPSSMPSSMPTTSMQPLSMTGPMQGGDPAMQRLQALQAQQNILSRMQSLSGKPGAVSSLQASMPVMPYGNVQVQSMQVQSQLGSQLTQLQAQMSSSSMQGQMSQTQMTTSLSQTPMQLTSMSQTPMAAPMTTSLPQAQMIQAQAAQAALAAQAAQVQATQVQVSQAQPSQPPATQAQSDQAQSSKPLANPQSDSSSDEPTAPKSREANTPEQVSP